MICLGTQRLLRKSSTNLKKAIEHFVSSSQAEERKPISWESQKEVFQRKKWSNGAVSRWLKLHREGCLQQVEVASHFKSHQLKASAADVSSSWAGGIKEKIHVHCNFHSDSWDAIFYLGHSTLSWCWKVQFSGWTGKTEMLTFTVIRLLAFLHNLWWFPPQFFLHFQKDKLS